MPNLVNLSGHPIYFVFLPQFNGNAWEYFPYNHARSRAYRWGEDGLAGFCDRHGEICLALALWNGKYPILKERLFGLTNRQGNHGEDVKECKSSNRLDSVSSKAHSATQYLRSLSELVLSLKAFANNVIPSTIFNKSSFVRLISTLATLWRVASRTAFSCCNPVSLRVRT